MRKLFFLFFLFIFTTLTIVPVSALPLTTTSPAQISVRIDGKLVHFDDQKPMIDENGRTLVPLRFVAETLNTEVEWDGRTQSAFITKGSQTITLTLGKKEVTITDGKSKTMTTHLLDTAAILKNSRILVPVRFISETLGQEVKWSNPTRTVYIFSK